MSMIDDIRNHFTLAVNTVDSDLRFDGQIFEVEQTSSTYADNTYKLLIGDATVSRVDASYSANIACEVWIYKISGTNRVEDFDNSYCKALEIAAVAQDQRLLDQSGFIKSVLGVNVLREAIDGDDNSVRFRIQFNTTVYYSIE